MRIVETYITADGRVTQDPRLAVRIDRDWYDDDGRLVSREWWLAEPATASAVKS